MGDGTARPGEPGPGAGHSPMVGRAAELAEAFRLLAAAEAGSGGLLILRGEAGIGKTRLIRELASEAARRGIQVGAAEASLLDQARPFGACADALAGPGHGRAAAPADGVLLEDLPVEVNSVLEDLIGVFEDRCTAAPLLLVIDNLHWVDNSSLVLLRRLATLARQYAALVVVTTRPSERPEVATTLLAVQRAGGTVIDLGPLEDGLVLELARELAGGPPGARLAGQLARAAGNPLFVVELLTALLEGSQVAITPDGTAEVAADAPPASLTVPILRHLALLPRKLTELLRVAAVCGRAVDPAELALLSGRDALRVARDLRAAERAGIMEVRGEHLWFRHELIHDALYHDWPRPVTRSLHRELGTRLAAVGAPTWRIAHHLALGATEGDMMAVDYLHRAGQELAPRDPVAAIALLERAVALTPATAEARDTIRADLVVALAWAGRLDDAERLAASLAAESLSRDVRGRTAAWLASDLLRRGRPREAHDLCQQALRAGVGADREALILRIVAEYAAMTMGDGAGALTRLRDLLPTVTALGDGTVRSMCLTGMSTAEANAGHLAAATAYGAEAVREAESARSPQGLVISNHVLYAWVLEEQDRCPEALAVAERIAAAIGDRSRGSTRPQVERWRARCLFAAGRWEDALVDLDSSLMAYDAGVDAWPEALALRALIRVHRGDLKAAWDDIGRFDAALAAGTPCLVLDQPALARAFLLEADGQLMPALEVLHGAWKIAEAAPLALAMPTIGPPLARFAVQAGRPEVARHLLAGLGRLAADNPDVPRLRAAQLWVTGLAARDPDALLAATAVQERAARPFDHAMLREDAAAALAAAGRAEQAVALLRQAQARYEELGAGQRAAHARARLRALGLTAGVGGRRGRPASGWAALTPAERHVVGLAAERLSNREIAERLFVSRRTIETHISHAFVKLGCASRRDLIAIARAHRPATGPA